MLPVPWVLLVAVLVVLVVVAAVAVVALRLRERRLPVSRLSERGRRRRSRVHVSEIPSLATLLAARSPGRAAPDLDSREDLVVRLGEAFSPAVRERVGSAYDGALASPGVGTGLADDLAAQLRTELVNVVEGAVESVEHPLWDVLVAAHRDLNASDDDLLALAAREGVLAVAPVLLAGAWRCAPVEAEPARAVRELLERLLDVVDDRVQGDPRRVWSPRQRPVQPDPDAVLLVELGDAIMADGEDIGDGTTPEVRRSDGRSVIATFAHVLPVVDSMGAPADRRAAYAVASLLQTILVTWLLGAGLDGERAVMLAAASEDLVARLRGRGLTDELSESHVDRCARLVYRSVGLLELAETPAAERTTDET